MRSGLSRHKSALKAINERHQHFRFVFPSWSGFSHFKRSAVGIQPVREQSSRTAAGRSPVACLSWGSGRFFGYSYLLSSSEELARQRGFVSRPAVSTEQRASEIERYNAEHCVDVRSLDCDELKYFFQSVLVSVSTPGKPMPPVRVHRYRDVSTDASPVVRSLIAAYFESLDTQSRFEWQVFSNLTRDVRSYVFTFGLVGYALGLWRRWIIFRESA